MKKNLIKRTLKYIVGTSFLLVMLALVSSFLKDYPYKKKLKELDICFRRDLPGTTDRFVLYIAHSCKNPQIVLDQSNLAANWGRLTYKDINNDGIPEILIKGERPIWDGSCAEESSSLYQIDLESKLPKFKLISKSVEPGPC